MSSFVGSWNLATAVGCVVVAVVAASIWWPEPADAATRTQQIALDDLQPGSRVEFGLASQRIELSIPASEGLSTGTLECRVHGQTEAVVVERDGSPESVTIADLDSDGVEDALLTIRSAGSGSFAQLVLLQIADGEPLRTRELPPGNEVLPDGYGGHDEVELRRDGSRFRIVRTFPTYRSTDLQSNPTGADTSIVFDVARWSWHPDD